MWASYFSKLLLNLKSKIVLIDKIILVTGATSGIGYESSRVLSKLGAKLIIIGRSISKLKSLKNSLVDTSKVITYEAFSQIEDAQRISSSGWATTTIYFLLFISH